MYVSECVVGGRHVFLLEHPPAPLGNEVNQLAHDKLGVRQFRVTGGRPLSRVTAVAVYAVVAAAPTALSKSAVPPVSTAPAPPHAAAATPPSAP